MLNKKIDSFFKKKTVEINTDSHDVGASTFFKDDSIPILANRMCPNVESQIQKNDNSQFERDPGLRKSIWDYSEKERDEVRRYYLSVGPFQPQVARDKKYVDSNGRRFLTSWYRLFPDWLEFSPTKNAAFCLPCSLFIKPSSQAGGYAFKIDGFRNWKKVNDGKNCVFANHMGKDPNSLHKQVVQNCHDLLNSLQHLDNIVENHTSEQVAKNRLQIQASIDVVKWCAFQAVGFRGRDESGESSNRGNFYELLRLLASYNKDVGDVVLENAPKNAQYSSPTIQKEILSIYSRKVQNYIREEIGENKFCILVDESRDSSRREQMAIILRFVDKDGYIRERFFDIVHVQDTRSSSLKKVICDILSQHNLSLQNIRGQGYDGASNMRGEFNGLQALIL